MTPLQLIHQELKKGNHYPFLNPHISIWSPKTKTNIFIEQQKTNPHIITITTNNPYQTTLLTVELTDPTSIDKIEQLIKEHS